MRLADGRELPAWELRFRNSLSGGPGGQHANTSATRVTLIWNLPNSSVFTAAEKAWLGRRLANRLTTDGDLLLNSDGTRSQKRNREEVIDRLVALLDEALKRPKRRRATKPTRGSQRRRVDAKKQRGALKASRRPPSED